METRTLEYKHRAEEIMHSGFSGDGVKHMWTPGVDDEDCKVHVKEFEGDYCDLTDGLRNSNSVHDRLMYWENTPKDGSAKKTNRRIIIVENVGPENCRPARRQTIHPLGVLPCDTHLKF